MKKLQYKSVIFESFELFNNDETDYVNEGIYKENLNGMDFGVTYICPACIEKHGMYIETNTQKGGICVDDGYTCCVEGCSRKDAIEIRLDIKESNLI